MSGSQRRTQSFTWVSAVTLSLLLAGVYSAGALERHSLPSESHAQRLVWDESRPALLLVGDGELTWLDPQSLLVRQRSRFPAPGPGRHFDYSPHVLADGNLLLAQSYPLLNRGYLDNVGMGPFQHVRSNTGGSALPLVQAGCLWCDGTSSEAQYFREFGAVAVAAAEPGTWYAYGGARELGDEARGVQAGFYRLRLEEHAGGKRLAVEELPASPGPRALPGLAYDTKRERLYLWSGVACTAAAANADCDGTRETVSNELWMFQDNKWTRVTMPPGKNSPRGRVAPAMEYIAATDRIVLFGGNFYRKGTEGLATSAMSHAVWELHPETFTWRRVAVLPMTWGLPSMAYHPEEQRLFLHLARHDFGGVSWSRLYSIAYPPAEEPDARDVAAVNYERVTNERERY